MSLSDKPVDTKRPLQTKNGMPVRVLCEDLRHPKPIVFAARKPDGHEVVMQCDARGRVYIATPSPHDLVNVP